MAWCETQTQHDMILLIETHWRATSDYGSGWQCIHASGYTEQDQPDRYAGILCLVSGKSFAMPSVRELVPGRNSQRARCTATYP